MVRPRGVFEANCTALAPRRRADVDRRRAPRGSGSRALRGEGERASNSPTRASPLWRREVAARPSSAERGRNLGRRSRRDAARPEHYEATSRRTKTPREICRTGRRGCARAPTFPSPRARARRRYSPVTRGRAPDGTRPDGNQYQIAPASGLRSPVRESLVAPGRQLVDASSERD